MRFASPSFLALLLFLPTFGLIFYRFHRWQTRQANLWKIPRYRHLGLSFPHRRLALRSLAFLLALASGILALARPLGPSLPKDQTQDALDIVILLDLSPSMRLRDSIPDRWQRSVLEIAAFFRRQRGDRFALVAVDREAGLLCPWTDDTSALQDILWQSPPGTLDDDGAGLPDALAIVLSLFRRPTQRFSSPVLLLLSDGFSSNEIAAPPTALHLQRLRSLGVSTFILSIGSSSPPLPGSDPPPADPASSSEPPLPPFQPLHSSGLRTLASLVGGSYASLTSQGFGLLRLHHTLQGLQRQAIRRREAQTASPRHGPFLLSTFGFLFLALIFGLRTPDPLSSRSDT